MRELTKTDGVVLFIVLAFLVLILASAIAEILIKINLGFWL